MGDIVVVAWDASIYAMASVQYALEHFEPQDIRVVCVLERPNPYAFGINWGPDAEKNALNQCAADFSRRNPDVESKGVKFFPLFGDPAARIVQFAKEENANLIVTATHGRSGIGRLLLGSVAQKVLAHADCPIIVLPRQYVQQSIDAKENVDIRMPNSI